MTEGASGNEKRECSSTVVMGRWFKVTEVSFGVDAQAFGRLLGFNKAVVGRMVKLQSDSHADATVF